MRFPPPEVIASWPEPNYVDPENRGPGLMIAEMTATIMAMFVLSLRMHVRINMLRKSGIDDWLMVAAMCFAVLMTIDVILANELWGWSLHVWDLTPTQVVQGRQVSLVGQAIFLLASGLVKVSILLSYLRIALPDSWFRRFTWTVMLMSIIVLVVFMILLWLQCIPISSYWDLTRHNRACMPEAPGLVASVIVQTIADFLVYILPMPTLYGLKLPLIQRIRLMLLFGLGGVVVGAGCARAYWVYHVEVETYDVTWYGYELWFWTAVEVNLGVICGCAPVLKHLVFRNLAGRNPQDGNRARKDGLRTIGSLPVRPKPLPELSTCNDTISYDQSFLNLGRIEAGRNKSTTTVINMTPVHGTSSQDSLTLPEPFLTAVTTVDAAGPPLSPIAIHDPFPVMGAPLESSRTSTAPSVSQESWAIPLAISRECWPTPPDSPTRHPSTTTSRTVSSYYFVSPTRRAIQSRPA